MEIVTPSPDEKRLYRPLVQQRCVSWVVVLLEQQRGVVVDGKHTARRFADPGVLNWGRGDKMIKLHRKRLLYQYVHLWMHKMINIF